MKTRYLLFALFAIMGTKAFAFDFQKGALTVHQVEAIELKGPDMRAGWAPESSVWQTWKADQPTRVEAYHYVPDMTLAPSPRMSVANVPNPNVRPYTFLQDQTWVGIPIFVAGILAKSDKASFRQDYRSGHANTRLLTNFKSSIDDYTQYFGPAMTLGLKLGGVEGRSDWPRFLASAAMSYGAMAILVNSIKYTAKEMRPDGSTANSWPSGHTATSFVGATILHKEYGLTRSPWYSVAGYGVATATGIMRVLNNRHWVSDVLSGAGIGIFSGELAYGLSDLIFKGKHLLRNDLDNLNESASFFSISTGLGLGTNSLGFKGSDLKNPDEYDVDASEVEGLSVDFRVASTVDVEGAYFFNKYVGVGGRLRVRAMTAKSWGDFVEYTRGDKDELLGEIASLYAYGGGDPANFREKVSDLVTEQNVTIESDHLTEFSANVGVYFNLPISRRLSLGTKLLIGRTMTQELDVNAHFKGQVKNMDYSLTINNGEPDVASFQVGEPTSTGASYDVSWDYITLGGNNSTTYGTGLSLTYKLKGNFAWRLFADYDYSHKTFTLKYDPYRFLKHATPTMEQLYRNLGTDMEPYEFEMKKKMHYFTLGASFTVSF